MSRPLFQNFICGCTPRCAPRLGWLARVSVQLLDRNYCTEGPSSDRSVASFSAYPFPRVPYNLLLILLRLFSHSTRSPIVTVKLATTDHLASRTRGGTSSRLVYSRGYRAIERSTFTLKLLLNGSRDVNSLRRKCTDSTVQFFADDSRKIESKTSSTPWFFPPCDTFRDKGKKNP